MARRYRRSSDIEYQLVTKANLNDPKVQALKN